MANTDRSASARGEPAAPASPLRSSQISAARQTRWAGAQLSEGPVLLFGSEGGQLEIELAERGIQVVCVEPRSSETGRALEALRPLPEDLRARVTFRESEPEQVEHEPGGFAACVIGNTLLSQLYPRLLIQSALRQLRPGGLLIVTIPFAESREPGAIQSFGLDSLAAILRSLCDVAHLSLVDDTIFFAGVNRPPSGENWGRYSAQWMLTATETAARILKRRLFQSIDARQADLLRLQNNIRFRVGELVVEAVKNPARALRLPLELLRLVSSRRNDKKSRARARSAASAVELPLFPIPRIDLGKRPVVAAILDQFSQMCWQYEGHWVPISRVHWKEQIDEIQPDVFFMESTWKGPDGSWAPKRVTASLHELSWILEYCRSKSIPSVYWNKEDPPNFERFIEIARLFDHVFTTDSNCIPRYVARCGHSRVYALPFAAQPALHNPMRLPGMPEYRVCFAGTWFANKYPDRAEALRVLLDPAIAHGLHIFDRNAREPKPIYEYPARYQASIAGTLSYEQMLTAYRAYRVMLNVNTVSDSPTMFSRRVFETLACGRAVISSPSVGMEAMLGSAVRVASTEGETRAHLEHLFGDDERYDREAHLGYRLVHREHTYANRLQTIFEKLGKPLKLSQAWPRVSVIMSTNRPNFLEQALRNYTQQSYPNRELILVLNQSAFDLKAVRKRAAVFPDLRVIQLDETHSLGQCLNAGLDMASGDYIAKMDDDDLYGAEFLWDLVLAARFSRTEVTGKGVYFAYVAGADKMGIRTVSREHGFVVRGLAGGALLVKRNVFDKLRFQSVPRGTDTRFLYDCESEGYSFYSADRYNYVMIRHADPQRHTWQIDDEEALRFCRNLKRGLDPSRALI